MKKCGCVRTSDEGSAAVLRGSHIPDRKRQQIYSFSEYTDIFNSAVQAATSIHSKTSKKKHSSLKSGNKHSCLFLKQKQVTSMTNKGQQCSPNTDFVPSSVGFKETGSLAIQNLKCSNVLHCRLQ